MWQDYNESVVQILDTTSRCEPDVILGHQVDLAIISHVLSEVSKPVCKAVWLPSLPRSSRQGEIKYI